VEEDVTIPLVDGIIVSMLAFVILSEFDDPVSSKALSARVIDGVNVVFSILTSVDVFESAEVTPLKV
jgi:hypothetical protein